MVLRVRVKSSVRPRGVCCGFEMLRLLPAVGEERPAGGGRGEAGQR